MSTSFHAAYAHLPTGLARDVRLTVDQGRFTRVESGQEAEAGDHRLPGVVLPGLANAHSHAFHRALRGRTHLGGGTFWTWREAMYAIAAQLDPLNYLTLARAAYAEMALAGVTAVGEFHYLHHGPGGARYMDPNMMGQALIQAAADAGIRLTLLDTCYLAGSLGPDGHAELDGPQLRFGDGDAETWAMRVDDLGDHLDGGPEHLRVGGAIHSVRAVPRDQLSTVADAVRARPRPLTRFGAGDAYTGPIPLVAPPGVNRSETPLHIHLSEQPAENEACLAAHGRTPTGLLEDEGVLGPDLSAVHATHLTPEDIALLGGHRSWACFCPTTERDLADGIGPAVALREAGARLSLGSDQHAVVDLIEEARALEMHERLATLRRGRIAPADLLIAAAAHESIGWPDAGRLEVGARADLVAVRDDTVRTAGADPEQILLAATASDVDTVIVDGKVVVLDSQHRLGDVGRLLHDAITPLWKGV
ncbi:formimidoylglutamate deiminase [Ornithinimicrobium pratense]|uniref:Formimidoylglutamate deiminase n=1 Tax=Ornithinimicrobium pratense TaxID=2593973 RepID=A0A5J6V346_9MICO|nr:formimidoylglutamate deiminase [Ornithinimicrobium pratense]QFG68118.1 formimidoylglutamate deiminase [Ornithinimicrobium pratense]